MAAALVVVAVLVSCRSGGRETAPALVLHPSPAPSGYGAWGRPGGAEPFAMAPDSLRAWSLGVPREHASGGDVHSPCGLIEAEQRFWVSDSHQREWEAGEDTAGWTLVTQAVRLYFRDGQVLSAAEVVGQIRARTTCETYNSREGTPRLTGEISLPKDLPGVQATFGFCERIDPDYRACTGYLAREEVMSKVRVRTSEGVDAERLLRELLPVAAEALAKA